MPDIGIFGKLTLKAYKLMYERNIKVTITILCPKNWIIFKKYIVNTDTVTRTTYL